MPDLLVAEGRYGVVLGEDPAVARTALEHAVADAAARDPWLRDNPPVVSWPGGQFGSGMIDVDHPLVHQTRSAVAAVTGSPSPPLAAVPYGSDLRLYAGIGGIPTLHYGPGDVRFAHAPREQVRLDEVLESARAMAVLVARRCGAHV